MEEVENNGGEQATVHEEIASPQTEANQEVKNPQVAPVESRQERNWREMRQRQADLERENQLLREMHQRSIQPQVQPQEPQVDLISELSKQDYVPGELAAKSIKKVQEEFAKQLQELKNQYQQSKYVDSINELRKEYPDLEDVVNPDTLQIVKEKNPRLAQAWQGLDDYSIYVQAYPYIKNTGILDEATGSRRAKEVEKKIEQNKKTVQTPQAFEKRPMAQAFNFDRLSESQKKDLFNEMTGYARLSGGY